MFEEWEAMAERQRAQDAVQYERERHTLVQLLEAAGQPALALVIAGSEYRRDCVDNWNGGQYEVTLGIPPEHLFNITDEHRGHLERCAQVIVGERQYQSLTIGVRLAEHQPGWDAEFAQRLWARLNAHTDAQAALQ
jgi:hypothetical protein